MTNNHRVRLYAATLILYSQPVVAEEYENELGATYSQVEASASSLTAIVGIPTTTVTSSSDADTFSLRGAWFYTGLSDDEGPRSRAAFIDRASSLTFRYSQVDQASSVLITGNGVPSLQSSSSQDTKAFSVNLRHVWKDSGWFGVAGLSRASFDGEFSSGTFTADTDGDATSYTLGFGKYLADTTSLDLRVATQDRSSSTASAVSLNLEHLGRLGDTWMYGADVNWTKTDTAGDGDAYDLRGSLYPNSNLDFGLGYSQRDVGGGIDAESVELFVGWFFSDSTRLQASYREDTTDTVDGIDADTDGFQIGITGRF